MSLCELLIIISFIVVSSLLSMSTFDGSWDGQSYHIPSIIYLFNGESIFNGFNAIQEYFLYDFDSFWSDHYPKAAWILASDISKLFNNVNASSSLVFIIAFFVWCYVLTKNKELHSKFPRILAAILVLNPVVLNQVFTNYVDGILYLLFLYIIYSTVCLCIKYNKIDLFVFIFSSILIINIKTSCIIYPCTSFLIYFIYNFLYKKNIDKCRLKAFFCSIAIVLVVAYCIVGYNPYILNIANGKNIFYPVIGENQIDIISEQINKEFRHKNRIEKIFISIFSETENDRLSYPSLKTPGNFTQKEFLFIPDARIGGFGPFFSLSFTLSILLLFSKHSNKSLLFLFFLFISTFVHPESWWARYSPQLWCLPILPLFFSTCFKYNIQKYTDYILIILYFISILIPVYGIYINYTYRMNYIQYFTNKYKDNILLVTQDNNLKFNPIPFLNKTGLKYIYIPSRYIKSYLNFNKDSNFIIKPYSLYIE